MEQIKMSSLSRRVIIGLAVFIALVAIAIQSFARLAEASAEEWRHAEKRTLWAFQISQLRESVATQRAEQLAMLTAPEAQQAILETSVRQRSQDISRITNDFHVGAMDLPELSGQLKELTALHSAVRRRENLQILPGLREGNAAAARAMLLGVQQKDFNRLQNVVKELAEKMEQGAMEEAATATAATRAAQSTTITVVIASMIIAAIALVLLLLTGASSRTAVVEA